MRARSVWWALILTAATAGIARAADPPYYLALGDSLAVGVQPTANGVLLPTNQGYVDDLYAFYHARFPTLQLKKLGCSGETTTSMLTGALSPCYTAPDSQLAEAVAFLDNNRVPLITIDIGADNLLTCLSLTAPSDPACITAAATTVAGDLIQILGTLRLHAPQALIVGMNYYDPLAAAFIFGPQGQQLAVASIPAVLFFNQALAGAYHTLQIPVADVESTFRTRSFPANVILALGWTWMSAPPPRGPDVHPNPLGYAAIAAAFAKTIAVQ